MLCRWLAMLLTGAWLRVQTKPAISATTSITIQITIESVTACVTVNVAIAATVTTAMFIADPTPFGVCILRWLERAPRTIWST